MTADTAKKPAKRSLDSILRGVEKKHTKTNVEALDFRPGDTVRVHVKIKEGDKERIQVFQGVVIRRQGDGVHAFVFAADRRQR